MKIEENKNLQGILIFRILDFYVLKLRAISAQKRCSVQHSTKNVLKHVHQSFYEIKILQLILPNLG